MQRRGRLVVSSLALLAAAGLIIFLLLGKSYTIVLTEAEIQTKLDAAFPITRSYLGGVEVTLSNPRAVLPEGSNRIIFTLTASVNLSLGKKKRTLHGTATVASGLRYDSKEHAFYLNEPKLEALEIQGIPVTHTKLVNKAASAVAKRHIESLRIYTLRRDELKQAAARVVLKELVARDGQLIIKLGI